MFIYLSAFRSFLFRFSKKVILIGIICGILLFNFLASFAQEKGYQINCELKGLTPGSTAFLVYILGNTEIKTATCVAGPTGDLHFVGSDNLSAGIYKVILQDQKMFYLIANKQTRIDIQSDVQNLISSMRVLNDEENKYFYQYLNTIEINQGKIDTLKYELRRAHTLEDSMTAIKKGNAAILAQNSMKSSFVKSHSFPILTKLINLSKEPAMSEAQLAKINNAAAYLVFYKAHFLDNVDFNDTITLHLPQFQSKISINIMRVTKQEFTIVWKEVVSVLNLAKSNKELYKYLVNYFTFCYDGSKVNGMDAMFVEMAQNYFLKDQIFWRDSFMLYRMLDKINIATPLLNGQKIPMLNLKDENDIWHSVEEGNSNYTVVVFYDPDCKHCIQEVPILKEYYDQVHDKGVNVYAVCIGPDRDKWKQFIIDYKLDWVNVADFDQQFNLLRVFDVNTYPQFFLLNNDKNIVAKKIDLNTLLSMLRTKIL